MKTGKFIFGFAFIAVMAILLGGCFSLPGKVTVDPDIPIEESAVVKFYSSVYVKEYNGINVEDGWYRGDGTKNLTATIPAGETHLLFDIYASFDRRNTTYFFEPKNIELKFNFEAGKEYTVNVYASKNEGSLFLPKQKIILAIWDRILSVDDGTSKEDGIVKAWELGEF